MRTIQTKNMSALRKPKFNVGEFVFLKTDPDQLERQIVCVMDYGLLYQYILACGVEQTNHFEYEITTHRNVLLGLN